MKHTHTFYQQKNFSFEENFLEKRFVWKNGPEALPVFDVVKDKSKGIQLKNLPKNPEKTQLEKRGVEESTEKSQEKTEVQKNLSTLRGKVELYKMKKEKRGNVFSSYQSKIKEYVKSHFSPTEQKAFEQESASGYKGGKFQNIALKRWAKQLPEEEMKNADEVANNLESSENEKDFKHLESIADVFYTIYEANGDENMDLRKKTFEKNKDSILRYAKEKGVNIDKKYTGTSDQNTVFADWMKSSVFSPKAEKIFNSHYKKNNYTPKYTKEYYDNPKTNFSENNIKFSESIEKSDGERYHKAMSDLEKNVRRKGRRIKENSIVIISDISNNRLIVKQKGQADWIIPSVYGKGGVGNVPKSHATPTGSFQIKTRSINGVGRPASSSPNITGAAMTVQGLESSNANSAGRGILIHGLPGVSQGDIIQRAKTFGCTGLTDQDAIKLAQRIQSAPNAFMQQIT